MQTISTDMTSAEFVRPLEELTRVDGHYAGGKGANLGELLLDAVRD